MNIYATPTRYFCQKFYQFRNQGLPTSQKALSKHINTGSKQNDSNRGTFTSQETTESKSKIKTQNNEVSKQKLKKEPKSEFYNY